MPVGAREATGEAALGAGGQLVAQPYDGEGAADHHLVVALLEVPVSRQHRAHRQVVVGDRRAHLGDEAGVADTGGAAVADEVEPEPVEVGQDPLEAAGEPVRAVDAL